MNDENRKCTLKSSFLHCAVVVVVEVVADEFIKLTIILKIS